MKFLFVSILFALAQAQDFTINCNFFKTSNGYTCQINESGIYDNEKSDIRIGGQHLDGLTNDDVLVVLITNSSVPFVITEVFTTFPNLYFLSIMKDSRLARIQTGAFRNASNLEFVFISGLSELKSIEANAFKGGSKIMSLDLILNKIETIHETAFDGLVALRFLYLDGNQITHLPGQLFRSCKRLETLNAPVNFLDSLDGRLLSNSLQVRVLDFSRNSINAIGFKFLNELNNLTTFRLEGNRCANDSWTISDKVTIDTIRGNLNYCFRNADTKLKRFKLEVKGSIVLRNEDGSELIRI